MAEADKAQAALDRQRRHGKSENGYRHKARDRWVKAEHTLTKDHQPAQQLAARTGISYGTVRVLLTKLKTRGLVASHQRGVWLLNYDNVRVLRPDPSGYGMQEVAR